MILRWLRFIQFILWLQSNLLCQNQSSYDKLHATATYHFEFQARNPVRCRGRAKETDRTSALPRPRQATTSMRFCPTFILKILDALRSKLNVQLWHLILSKWKHPTLHIPWENCWIFPWYYQHTQHTQHTPDLGFKQQHGHCPALP